ncbi:hypothetical protein MSP8887_00509 [Marinomonas spartinae]|uniref:hypothetical protein n=1 Tax=Marinomonas spartinae TaxID=1792290 RepID=UPI0008090520|nr:hypothetical protein [Marinomonas spartinae]SBS26835.1 hypothetical protein MSP8887_00509 [Marinomonas spartinae]
MPIYRSSIIKKSWLIALFCAIAIHGLILFASKEQNWLDLLKPSALASKKTLEVSLITPEKQTQTQSNRQAAAPSLDNPKDNSKSPKQPSTTADTTNHATQKTNTANSTKAQGTEFFQSTSPTNTTTQQKKPDSHFGTVERNGVSVPAGNRHGLDSKLLTSQQTKTLTDKPELLDISKISLSPDADMQTTSKIFSKELRQKIEESKAAQREYLKGVDKSKNTNYPITEDADGTRYVNIKGVCWRMPKEDATDDSKKGWAIVFDGCGIKSKLFHFELNISPSILTNELLGPDSPFNLEQQPK